MDGSELIPEDLATIAEIDQLVHQPARLSILALLYVVESASFLYVTRQTGLTRGNLSSHVSKLESAGYVDVKKEFVDKIPRTLLRITEEGRNAISAYTKNMNKILKNLET